jgi:hypothetical protein
MKIGIWLATALLTAVSTIFLFVGDIRAENFTLSDEGIMMLHIGTYLGDARASLTSKKDVPGPGVEFEMYMPASKAFEGTLDMVCSNYDRYDRSGGPNEPLVGTKVGKYDSFELKFTLISINGKTTADAGGTLIVGAKIGCEGSRGGFRPMSLGFGEGQDTNAVSTTSNGGETISEIGFTAYIANISDWEPNGSTVKLLVEPVAGDAAIPEQAQRERNEAKGKYIYVDANASETGNGTSWDRAFKYLQDGLAVAKTGDQIWVAQGVYTPDRDRHTSRGKNVSFTLKNGVAVYGGFPRGGGKWEDGNPSAYQTVLSGDLKANDAEITTLKDLPSHTSREDNSIHVVTASGTDETAVLDGFVITGGNTQTKNPEKGYLTIDLMQGGGLYCRSGSPTITNCIFKFNSAEEGGAVYFWRGNPKLTKCKFIDNYAQDSGAGIYLSECNPAVINCVFSRNTALEKGGAIYNEFNKAIIINCTITKNYAYAGGGLYNQKSTPMLTNCILWGNTSRYGADEPAQVYGVKINAGHCCIQGLTAELGGTANIAKDPLLADIEKDGYHLSANSPCINAGDSNAVPDEATSDIDDNPRITGSAVDIGACEYAR